MTRDLGHADEAAFGKQADIDTESGSYGLETMTDVRTFEFGLDNRTEVRYSANASIKPEQHADLTTWPAGQLIYRLVDPRVFEMSLGALVDGGATNAFTVTVADALDYWSFKANIQGTAKYAKILGCKMDGFTLELPDKDSPITITQPYIGKDLNVITGAISASDPAQAEIESYQCYVKYDGSAIGVINRMRVVVGRGLEAKRGIEQMTGGEERQISEVVEKNLIIDFDFDLVVENSTYVEAVLGGTSITNAARTEVDIVIVVSSSAGRVFNITLSNCLLRDFLKDVAEESEERIQRINGSARNISIAGQYAAAP